MKKHCWLLIALVLCLALIAVHAAQTPAAAPAPSKPAVKATAGMDIAHTGTCGTLARNDAGELVFTHSPWLVLAPRTLTLPKATYAVGKGIFHSEIVQLNGDDHTTAFTLPPRYSMHEETLSQCYGLGATTDVGIIAGLKSIGRFIGELCGFGPKPVALA